MCVIELQKPQCQVPAAASFFKIFFSFLSPVTAFLPASDFLAVFETSVTFLAALTMDLFFSFSDPTELHDSRMDDSRFRRQIRSDGAGPAPSCTWTRLNATLLDGQTTLYLGRIGFSLLVVLFRQRALLHKIGHVVQLADVSRTLWSETTRHGCIRQSGNVLLTLPQDVQRQVLIDVATAGRYCICAASASGLSGIKF